MGEVNKASPLLQWAQPVVTVVSLAFGGGILYADVQDVKRELDSGKGLKEQVLVMEANLSATEETQRRTAAALEKVVDAVNKLNVTVSKLEIRLDK